MTPAHRSAVSKARQKVDPIIFENILDEANKVAYELWPKDPAFTWHGMTVIAFDGSKYNLPATASLREAFDPGSGLQNPGRGHYPECLVSTAYDVLRRIPLARTITGFRGSERDEAVKMLDKIPPHGVLLFDRGYPSFGLIKILMENYSGFFSMRCKSTKTFPAVQDFLASGQQDSDLWIKPTQNYLNALPKGQRSGQSSIKLRAIRLIAPDGTISVLLTNMFDREEFPTHEIIELYFRRWAVEDHYRNEKVIMEVEKFHSGTENGIRQELLAACIMTTITRTLMILSQKVTRSKAVEPQFTHALNALAVEAAVLAPDQPEKSIEIFIELIEEMARVKYYRSKKKRPGQPRINKKPISKWLRVKRKNKAKKQAET